MILAGDVGGTKTVLALFACSGGNVHAVREEAFSSREHASIEDVLARFLKAGADVHLEAACLGVAGPVMGGKSETTNLPWLLDEKALAVSTGAPRVRLLNDLEATAYGVLFLRGEEVSQLNARVQGERAGNVAVIAPGTGLGEAMLYWDGMHYHPIASEGGHADFAPRTDEEIELLRYLRARFGGHVSYERVLSGPGIYNIYCCLRDTGYAAEPPWLAEKLATGDPTPIIAELGVAGAHPLCVKTLEMLGSLLGAEAGNLALKCLAVGGVFVGGGIGPKVLPVLQNGSFMCAFVDKGRFAELMGSIAVSVVLNPRTPLLGAAHFALRLTEA
jgi:glucokinase